MRRIDHLLITKITQRVAIRMRDPAKRTPDLVKRIKLHARLRLHPDG